MQKITPEQAMLFRKRWKAVAQVEKEEARQATLEDRWQQLNAIYRIAMGLKLINPINNSKQEVYLRWAKLKDIHQYGQR
jgi:hypothetical protein